MKDQEIVTPEGIILVQACMGCGLRYPQWSILSSLRCPSCRLSERKLESDELSRKLELSEFQLKDAREAIKTQRREVVELRDWARGHWDADSPLIKRLDGILEIAQSVKPPPADGVAPCPPYKDHDELACELAWESHCDRHRQWQAAAVDKVKATAAETVKAELSAAIQALFAKK